MLRLSTSARPGTRRDSNNHRPELSRREVQVALGIGQGLTCQELGKRLRLKYETVRSYVKRLRDKTTLRRKPQLAAWATTNQRWLTARLEKEQVRR